MKLKDYVYDKDLEKATIFLEEVKLVQLKNLLLILQEDPDDPEFNKEVDYEEIIFEGDN